MVRSKHLISKSTAYRRGDQSLRRLGKIICRNPHTGNVVRTSALKDQTGMASRTLATPGGYPEACLQLYPDISRPQTKSLFDNTYHFRKTSLVVFKRKGNFNLPTKWFVQKGDTPGLERRKHFQHRTIEKRPQLRNAKPSHRSCMKSHSPCCLELHETCIDCTPMTKLLVHTTRSVHRENDK